MSLYSTTGIVVSLSDASLICECIRVAQSYSFQDATIPNLSYTHRDSCHLGRLISDNLSENASQQLCFGSRSNAKRKYCSKRAGIEWTAIENDSQRPPRDFFLFLRSYSRSTIISTTMVSVLAPSIDTLVHAKASHLVRQRWHPAPLPQWA